MANSTNKISKGRLWVSYILQSLVVILFLMGAVMNLLQTDEAVAGATAIGFPESAVVYFGVILLVSTLLYVIPTTSGFGAILLTGWLGGAVATHIINGDPTFNVLFPIIVGIIVWFALWLRSEKVQQLVSLN